MCPRRKTLSERRTVRARFRTGSQTTLVLDPPLGNVPDAQTPFRLSRKLDLDSLRGRGVTASDFDNSGDIDLLISSGEDENVQPAIAIVVLES